MEIHAKIKNLGDILISEAPKPDTDYLVSLRVALSEIKKIVEDSENPLYIYVLKYINTESIQEIGTSKKIKFETGRTLSQKIRSILWQLATKYGRDPEEYYQERQKKRIIELLNELDL